MKFCFIALLIMLCCTSTGCSQYSTQDVSADYRFNVVTLADHLSHPWSVAFLPEGGFLVTERNGKLQKISPDGTKRVEITGLPAIKAEDQGGLLDIILAPDFRSSRTVFFSYTASGPGGTGTEVARAQLKGNTLQGVRTIFVALPKTPAAKHYGSRLLIAPDGKLFITLGEKTMMHEAQNRTNHLGKVIRINQDGTVPADNPFRNIKGFRPEIYTWGNRNVQGIILNPVTRAIWINEHGPMGGDEINILKAGANYGWPLVTYGIDYTGEIISTRTEAPGIEPPILQWTPCIAPSGMTWYNGDKFPKWKGNIFVGSLVQQHLRRLEVQGNRIVKQEVLLKELHERIRDVRTGPDGYLYVLTDNDNGRLLRLEPLK